MDRAFALSRHRIGAVKVLESGPAHEVGCWTRYARMHTLRSPKNMKGIELDIPSLHTGRWFEARYGKAAWEATDLVPREDWNEYLTWYRDVTGADVDFNTTVTAVHKPDALRQLLEHGVSLDGPSRALDALPAARQHKDRPAHLLPDPSRDNTRDALMDAGQVNDKHFVIFHVLLLNGGARKVHACLRHGLAAVVQGLQLLRVSGRHGLIWRGKERCRALGRVEPSARVEARSKHKPDMVRAQVLQIDAAGCRQRAKSRVVRLPKLL